MYSGRAIAFFSGFHNIKVIGQPAEASVAPVIVCAPHSSFMDVFVIFYCSMIPSSVSKQENAAMPLLGSRYTY